MVERTVVERTVVEITSGGKNSGGKQLSPSESPSGKFARILERYIWTQFNTKQALVTLIFWESLPFGSCCEALRV